MRPAPHHAKPTSAAEPTTRMAAKVPPSASLKRPAQAQAETTDQHGGARKKITVAIDPELLECRCCFGTLIPPLFQCANGHTTCSKCCDASDWESELESLSDSEPDLDLKRVPDPKCPMCRECETASRCRAMERVLDGLSVPCTFQQHGCAELIPYAEKQAHEASCAHGRGHCPIASCTGGYLGKSLSEHMGQDHAAMQRTGVVPGCLTPLKLSRNETARVLCLRLGSFCYEDDFLLVVDRNVPSGRSLSVIHINIGRPGGDKKFKYTLEVASKDGGVLSLANEAKNVVRLSTKYQPSSFLFVPDAIWDSFPEEVPVSITIS